MTVAISETSLLTSDDLRQFKEEGYVIKRVLTDAQIERYLTVFKTDARLANTERMTNLQFLQPATAITELQDAVCQETITNIVTGLLGGGQAVIDNAVLFYARAGMPYQQGWHRDVLQLNDEEIDPAWFTPQHLHNNVQINVPLIDDECLWYVPGSHCRALTDSEQQAFQGSKKITPVNAVLAEGQRISIRAGEAIFYNNNGVHRGYGDNHGVLSRDRATIQLGYHSTAHAPTYHFAVLNHRDFTPDYLEQLAPNVRQAVLLHIENKHLYKDFEQHHAGHQAFIKSQFTVKA